MSSLIPEKPVLVSPSLAATIGLEEATMLAILDDVAGHRQAAMSHEQGYAWLELNADTMRRHMPFWTDHDIQRVAKNLRDKGVILIASAPFVSSECLRFAFNEPSSQGAAPRPSPPREPIKPQAHNTPVYGANRIAPNWQPSDDVLRQLAQRNIPPEFIRSQIPEFITYWRERDEPAHAWGAKFIQRVVRAWRNHETDFQRRETQSLIDENWQPSDDALEVLVKHANINPQFVEDAVPEFVLYWRERGERSKTWNSKFIQHVRRQWNRYTATVENDAVPKPIPADWQPSSDVFDILRMANIDLDFARGLIQEFVLFWHDNQQVQSSWNTKFLQHIKYHWARARGKGLAEQGASNETRPIQSTRERTLEEDLTDRSWAY